jgi:thiamine biosynthesis lipoprotein
MVRLRRIMGCRGELAVAAPPGAAHELVGTGVRLLEHLERRWSRFLPDSDITRINRSEGEPIAVDPATVELVGHMAVGVRLTGGAFDPTMLGPIAALGYGPAWSRGAECSAAVAPHSSAWIDRTMIDPASSTIAIPAGAQLDAGAVGKGLAGDLVARELLALGATAVRVAVGGDVVVTMPTVIGVAGPPPHRAVVDRVHLAAGGVATSGIARSWLGPSGGVVHHVIDPATAEPVVRAEPDDVVQVTVAAASAAVAEMLATAVIVDPSAARIEALDRLAVGVVTVNATGDIAANTSWVALRGSSSDTMAVAS